MCSRDNPLRCEHVHTHGLENQDNHQLGRSNHTVSVVAEGARSPGYSVWNQGVRIYTL